jgi:hypothetical protein
MTRAKTLRRVSLGLLLYLLLCVIAGILVAEGTLHPARRPLSAQEVVTAQQVAHSLQSSLEDVPMTAGDGAILRAWIIRPQHNNGDAVILLHGLSDNRLGMAGYAQILLKHGYSVLMPDARAHGASGGNLATYGLIERDDIHRWFDWLQANQHPRCIFAFGESMGAAQLLQALTAEPRFCAIVAESPFSNFREIAYDRVGQFFHTGPWLGRTVLRPLVDVAFSYTRWKYNLEMQSISPEDAVAAARVPVFLVHGQNDGNIPVRHSRRIHARNARIVLWEVPNADHCGAISTAPQALEEKVTLWFANQNTGRSDRLLRIP